MNGLLLAGLSAAITLNVYAESPDQEKNAEACKQEINSWLTVEQQNYRAVLYGQTKAEDATIGTVSYIGKNAYYKREADNWYSIELDDENSDSEMDSSSNTPPRRGLFETKKTLTSELIPYLTKTLMDFQCNTDKVCAIVAESINIEEAVNASESFDIDDIAGCIPFIDEQSYVQCHLSKDGTFKSAEIADIVEYCQVAADQMLKQEGELLKVAVEYDAAYRSMLQFAGDFDLFLTEFRTPITYTLRNAASVIGWLDSIPCFTSSCAEYPINP